MAKKKAKSRRSGSGTGTAGRNSAEDFSLETQSVPERGTLAMPRGVKPRAGAGTATRARAGEDPQVLSYRHSDKRKNNPEVGMVKPENDPDEPHSVWKYDPHIEKLIDDALGSGDEGTMRAALQELKRLQQPYLNWTGKAERTSFEFDTVSLH